MCHLRNICYTCGHADIILVSACRATRHKTVRQKTTTPHTITIPHTATRQLKTERDDNTGVQYTVAACRSHKSVPEIEVKSTSECGPCLFEAVREGWNNIGEGIVKTENGGLNGGEEVAEEELEGLREERERREWGLRKEFPPQGRRAPSMRFRKLGEKVCGGSPLRYEVRREDIEDEGAAWGESSARDDGVGYTTFHDFFMDRYMWVGPSIDTTALERELELAESEGLEGGNDSGYSSAEPEEEQLRELVVGMAYGPDARILGVLGERLDAAAQHIESAARRHSKSSTLIAFGPEARDDGLKAY